MSLVPLSQFPRTKIDYLFTDIDDTLTHAGKLPDDSYAALWSLHRHGVRVIPVTGRPAGWCEMIARLWPVAAVVGENGAFYFRQVTGRMIRHFAQDERTRAENRKKLAAVEADVLARVPRARVASDQFARMFDLAIDFCEDVSPLPAEDVDAIVEVFRRHGATAKVSSIHVNGWFGNHDKLTMCRELARREFGLDLDAQNSSCAFAGDSPNDEPMFAFFLNSFAVANIRNFASQLVHKPKFVAASEGGKGFTEIAALFL